MPHKHERFPITCEFMKEIEDGVGLGQVEARLKINT